MVAGLFFGGGGAGREGSRGGLVCFWEYFWFLFVCLGKHT